MLLHLEQWHRPTRIQIIIIGQIPQILLRDVAIVSSFVPVGVVDDELAVGNPACEGYVCFFVEVGPYVAVDAGTDAAFGFVAERVVFEG
jgi:hypothetical protein